MEKYDLINVENVIYNLKNLMWAVCVSGKERRKKNAESVIQSQKSYVFQFKFRFTELCILQDRYMSCVRWWNRKSNDLRRKEDRDKRISEWKIKNRE